MYCGINTVNSYVVEEESGGAVRQLGELPGRGLDVLLADSLHDPLDVLLHRGLPFEQLRVQPVRVRLPLAVQPVAVVVREVAQQRPDLLGQAAVAVRERQRGQEHLVHEGQSVVVEAAGAGRHGIGDLLAILTSVIVVLKQKSITIILEGLSNQIINLQCPETSLVS